MVWFLVLLVLALLVAFLMTARRSPVLREPVAHLEPDLPAAERGLATPTVPEHLDVAVKLCFFSRSEDRFFRTLEQALPAGYRVFPNVRLNDVFVITAPPPQRRGTYARLRDKHVDFLIVVLPEHRPVAALELDGRSHDNNQQQHRDAVKDRAFQCAGLPLLRVRAEETHTPASLQALLWPHLHPTEEALAHA
ncbi:DUF2726 domain-containing protein [Deinococcus radiopugnans]|uniref:DUF2726 domain-containing protein n=2 Tax=Deinococcus radiopugnans ATCC 19172 TaxID=585398 RepID=A0ABR6NS19_9DEIO|nr:DUF2726 domain-containing protein [Deinococcus radiopugnans]MBB6016829.1 hypothetical protein [Deinococcus radiopugnans ATCC 19172]